MNSSRLDALLSAIDAANAEDPNREDADGQALPKEWLYGRRMSAWLERLRPDAPDPLRIAVRAQHIRRWEIPRSAYPIDRTGYLMWRKALYKFHADTAAALMRDAGREETEIDRVRFLLQKKQLSHDPDSQTLEDCACLVFLEHHFAEFAAKTDETKMIGILQKTWKKMSDQARAAALTLPFGSREGALIERALASPPAPAGDDPE